MYRGNLYPYRKKQYQYIKYVCTFDLSNKNNKAMKTIISQTIKQVEGITIKKVKYCQWSEKFRRNVFTIKYFAESGNKFSKGCYTAKEAISKVK